MRTPGKGTFVRSFGIITQSGFLVNIQASPTEECGRVFAFVLIGGIGFVGRAGGRCTRVRGCAGCMRYMRYRGGVRSDVRDTVEMCGAGTLSHSGGRRCGAGLAHADCTRVWGVRWRMRGVREHGVRWICASVRSDALRDFPCIRMCPRFSGAAFG